MGNSVPSPGAFGNSCSPGHQAWTCREMLSPRLPSFPPPPYAFLFLTVLLGLLVSKRLQNVCSKNQKVAAEMNALRQAPIFEPILTFRRRGVCVQHQSSTTEGRCCSSPGKGIMLLLLFLTRFLKTYIGLRKNTPRKQEITPENHSREWHDARPAFPASSPAGADCNHQTPQQK